MPVRAEAIARALPDGQVIRGLRWTSGPSLVLFLHEPGGDLDGWGSLPAQLASRLTLDVTAWDLPGHGLSDDPWQPERLPELVRELAGDTDAGRKRFVCAAGKTAGAALAVAEELELSGLILLSPEEPPDIRIARSPSVPKLVFAAAHAGDDLVSARRIANVCGGWTIVTSVPVATQETALLAGEWAPNVTDQIATFIRDRLADHRHRQPAR